MQSSTLTIGKSFRVGPRGEAQPATNHNADPLTPAKALQ